MGHALVTDLATVLGVAAITSVLFRFLRQPTVLGYLLAGLVVGPYIPFPLFADVERMHALSELGVILVMFSIGLEFSIKRMVRLLPTSGLTAILQISGMAWLGYVFGQLIGLNGTASLFVAGSLAISSTMVVAKVFETRPVDPRTRELVLGILVVQDVVAISLIAVLNAVAAGAGLSARELGMLGAELTIVMASILIIGLLVLTRVIRTVHRIGNAETTVVSMLALAFGLAVVAEKLGYSLALGAFLAGMLVAEAGRGRKTEHVVAPVKDLFAAIFFVSIGMTVDPVMAFSSLPIAASLAGVIILGQLTLVTLAGTLGGNGLRRSMEAGASLGQIGEFSFIIIGIGAGGGILPATLQPTIVTTAVLTAFTTPWVLARAHRWATALDRRLPRPVVDVISLWEDWLDQLRQAAPAAGSKGRLRRYSLALVVDALFIGGLVILAALKGDRLAAIAGELMGLELHLAETVVALTTLVICLPFAIALVRNAQRVGVELATRLVPSGPEEQPDLGKAPRRMLTVVIQLATVLAAGAPLLALTQPLLPLSYGAAVLVGALLLLTIYLWRTATDLRGHVRAATDVIFGMVQEQERGHTVPPMRTLVPGLENVRCVRLQANHPSVGRSLAELDIHPKTGAAILAIERSGSNLSDLHRGLRLETGDVVALVGASDSVDEGHRLLTGSKPSKTSDNPRAASPGKSPGDQPELAPANQSKQ